MKKWEKPQLIVLTRSQSQEAVLDGCKSQTGILGTPSVTFPGCEVLQGTFCYECYGISTS